jgi:hypothetical protein
MTAELPPASLRASHADRDLAVDILRVAAGDGRLTLAELDERLEAALTARTLSELAVLTADLPGGSQLHAAACPATICPLGPPRQVFNCLFHNGDHARPGPAAHPRPGPVTPNADSPAAARWALLRSLLNEPRPYHLLAG